MFFLAFNIYITFIYPMVLVLDCKKVCVCALHVLVSAVWGQENPALNMSVHLFIAIHLEQYLLGQLRKDASVCCWLSCLPRLITMSWCTIAALLSQIQSGRFSLSQSPHLHLLSYPPVWWQSAGAYTLNTCTHHSLSHIESHRVRYRVSNPHNPGLWTVGGKKKIDTGQT